MNRILSHRSGWRRVAPIATGIGATLCAAFVMHVCAAADAPVTSIDITKFAFAPKDVTVAPGTKVRWVNRDQTPHTVASQDANKTFASKAMDTDDQYEFTFAKEGDYSYYCTVHPFMTAVVHVRKAP